MRAILASPRARPRGLGCVSRALSRVPDARPRTTAARWCRRHRAPTHHEHLHFLRCLIIAGAASISRRSRWPKPRHHHAAGVGQRRRRRWRHVQRHGTGAAPLTYAWFMRPGLVASAATPRSRSPRPAPATRVRIAWSSPTPPARRCPAPPHHRHGRQQRGGGSPSVVPPPAGTAPTITTQPAALVVTTGGNATFTVVAAGTAPLGYRWQKTAARSATPPPLRRSRSRP